jgi:hypothetical protein
MEKLKSKQLKSAAWLPYRKVGRGGGLEKTGRRNVVDNSSVLESAEGREEIKVNVGYPLA